MGCLTVPLMRGLDFGQFVSLLARQIEGQLFQQGMLVTGLVILKMDMKEDRLQS